MTPKLTTAYKQRYTARGIEGMGYRQQTPAALGRIVKRPVLPRLYDDHPLKGEWAGYREFHADFDWIVIYRVAGRFLVLARTGSHSDLFKK